MITFAIGDIHGCFDQLTELLDRCANYAKGEPSNFVFLGDYIDRGPATRQVVQKIMDLQASAPQNIIALAGNHEDLLRRADVPADMALWLAHGGTTTLASYNVSSVEHIPTDHLDWLRALPTSYDDGKRFFVHAGIRPGISLDLQTRQDLLWIRQPFLSSTADHGRLIVHGHTPSRHRKPVVRQNRINIDTGAVYGGPLTAAVFTDRTKMPIAILGRATFKKRLYKLVRTIARR